MSAADSSVSRVTTHVLDAVTGRPAEGVAVELLAFDGVSWRSVDTGATDADGRVTRIGPDELPAGDYRLRFDTAAYFAAAGTEGFYPEVVVAFTVAESQHYHVPLLLNPYGYSTYRGS